MTTQALPLANAWRRSECLAAAFLVCFLNGTVGKVQLAIQASDVSTAAMGLFGISAIVIICVYLAFSSLLQADERPLRSGDLPIFAGAILLNLVPSSPVSWICLGVLAVRELLIAGNDRLTRRGAVLMLGASVPLFWGRILFSMASNQILKVDAFLVAKMTGANVEGNVVFFPDQSGFIWIADPCSSFQNISLAMLCWLMFTQYSGRERTGHDYLVCLLACFNVVLINVTRISIIALRPDLYETVHGPIGATVVGYLSTIVVLATCASGIKREPRAVA